MPVPADDVVLAAVLRRNPYELIRVYEERGYSANARQRRTRGAEMLGTISFDTYAARYGATGQYDTTGRDPAGDCARDTSRCGAHMSRGQREQ